MISLAPARTTGLQVWAGGARMQTLLPSGEHRARHQSLSLRGWVKSEYCLHSAH